MLVRLVQPSKASALMVFSVLGRTTVVRLFALLNASAGISVTPSGTVTFVTAVSQSMFELVVVNDFG